MGVALSSFISSITIALILTINTIRNTGFKIKRSVVNTLFKFSWPLWISGLLGLYIASSNRYFIRIFSSLDDVGLFELATNFALIIWSLVWMPFAQYWQTERFAIAKEDDPYPMYNYAYRIISCSVISAATGIVIFADLIIYYLTDELFHSAYLAIPFLAAWTVFHCLTIFVNFSFMKTGHTKEVTKNNMITAVVATVAYIALIPLYGFIGAAAAAAFAAMFQYAYAYISGKRFYDMRIRLLPLVKAFFIYTIASMACISLVDESNFLYLIALKSLIFLAAIFIVVTSFFPLQEIKVMIKSGINRFGSKT